MVVGLAHRYSPCLRSHRRRFSAASFKGLAELFDRPERPKLAALLTSSNYAGSMVAAPDHAPLIVAMDGGTPSRRSGSPASRSPSFMFFWSRTFVLARCRACVDWLGCADGKSGGSGIAEGPVALAIADGLVRRELCQQGTGFLDAVYLLQQRGLDLKAVGILTPIPYLLATVATAIGGWVMTRFFREREKFLLIVSAALTAIFLFAMYESKTIGALIFFQSLVYFFKSFVLATVVALPNKILPGDQIGTGLGMINFGGQCAGFVAPTVMGFLVTGTGSFDAAFDFLLAMTILAVVVARMIRNREVLVESLGLTSILPDTASCLTKHRDLRLRVSRSGTPKI